MNWFSNVMKWLQGLGVAAGAAVVNALAGVLSGTAPLGDMLSVEWFVSLAVLAGLTRLVGWLGSLVPTQGS